MLKIRHSGRRGPYQNLLLVCSQPSLMQGLGEPLRDLATLYPGRTVVTVLDPDAAGHTLSGWFRIESLPGRPLQAGGELVGLHVPADGSLLHSLLAPVWQDGLPLVLWWVGVPPYQAEWFESLLESTTRVIVDTDGFRIFPAGPTEAFDCLRGLAGFVCHPYHRDQVFSDLTWGRLQYWREWLAGVFDRQEDRNLLERLDAVEIDYWAPPGQNGISLVALYLAGWLARQFRWRIEDSLQGCEDGFVANMVSHGGKTFTLRLRGAASKIEDRPLRLREVKFTGELRAGQAFSFSVHRDENELYTLHRKINVAGDEAGAAPERSDHRLAHRRLSRRELVEIQLNSLGHDFVFEGALQLALDLVGSGPDTSLR